MIIMIMMIHMHVYSCSRTMVGTINVDSLADERAERNSADGIQKQTKLKLRKGITMDSELATTLCQDAW